MLGVMAFMGLTTTHHRDARRKAFKVYLIWYLALVAIWPLLVLALDFIRRNMPTKRVEAILNSVAENSIFAGNALILGLGAF
jgi:predicted permease